MRKQQDWKCAIGHFIWVTAVVALAATTASRAADLPGTGSRATKELANAEDQIFQAKIHKDFAVLERGFADEALYVHTPGVTQTKAEHIEAIRNGKLDYREISTEDRVVRVFGNIGITRGRIIQTVADRHHTEAYLAVYIKRDGRWQLLDFRTSPIPKSQAGGTAAPPSGANTEGQRTP